MHISRLRFAQADIHDFAQELLDALLDKIESARTASKVAENDHLMKCTSASALESDPWG